MRVLKWGCLLGYNEELSAAYASYYAEKHALDDSGADPSDWELPLWNKWEEVFFQVYRKHHT